MYITYVAIEGRAVVDALCIVTNCRELVNARSSLAEQRASATPAHVTRKVATNRQIDLEFDCESVLDLNNVKDMLDIPS